MIVPEYLPGEWHAVVAGGVVALLDPSTPADIVRAMWDAAPARGGLADQLEVLLRDGIARLRPFALVDLTGGRVHAALRGGVEVEVTGSAGVRVLGVGQVTTWSESSVEDADEVTVRVVGAQSSGAVLMPVISGVVRADVVRVVLGSERRASHAAVPEEVVADVEEITPAELAPPVSITSVDLPDVVSEPLLEAGLVPELELMPEPAIVPEIELVPELVAEPELAPEPEPELAPDLELVPEIEIAHEQEAVPESVVPQVSPRHYVPEVLPDISAHGSGADVVDGFVPSGVVAEAEAVLAADALRGHSDEVVPDDHDGLTILSSDLQTIRDQLPSWAGDAVPGPFRVAAKQLAPPAKILLSTGQVVVLDQTVLLGRAPQVSRVTNRELPRLVTLPSPQQDISRTHAEVRTDGDEVLVTDLRSTNGILVSRPGEQARRLHPGEATVIAKGEVVDLGDGVTFTVEWSA